MVLNHQFYHIWEVMPKLIVAVIITFVFTSIAAAESKKDITIATYNSPPHQYIDDNMFKGENINTLRCIFNKLNFNLTFIEFPLARALIELDKNTLDGVMPVGNNYAFNYRVTAPTSIEKWYWLTNFKQEEPRDFGQKVIGAVRGGTVHEWLTRNGYDVSALLNTKWQVLNMFIAGRVDAIIIDNSDSYRDIEFHRAIESIEHYLRFIKFEPHRLIFSNAAQSKYPNLINEFNENIKGCYPISLTLDQSEKSVVELYANGVEAKMISFLKSYAIDYTLEDKISSKEADVVNAQWKLESSNKSGLLYNTVLKSRLSGLLQRIQENANGDISEIMAIDKNGFTIAASQITTDLYQGDEAKFKKTFLDQGYTIFVDDIVFDESTKQFQSQVSFTLPRELSSIAVITVGINIEKALSHNTNSIYP